MRPVEKSALENNGLDKDALKKIFDHDYDEKDVLKAAVQAIKSKPSTPGATYALQNYGRGCDFSLSDLLGDRLAQEEYNSYAGIFLVDTDSGIGHQDSVRLLGSPQAQTITIEPPKANGYEAYINITKQCKFDKCIEATVGQEIEVIWKPKDKHYAQITKKPTVGADAKAFTIEEADRKLYIQREWFCVKGKADGKNFSELETAAITITIDGKDRALQNQKPLDDILESVFEKGIDIKVTADGYKDYTSKLLPPQPHLRGSSNTVHKDNAPIHISRQWQKEEILLHREEYKNTYPLKVPITFNDTRIEIIKTQITVITKGKPTGNPKLIQEQQTDAPQSGNTKPAVSQPSTESGNGGSPSKGQKIVLKSTALGCVLGALFVVLCLGVWWFANNYKLEWKNLKPKLVRIEKNNENNVATGSSSINNDELKQSVSAINSTDTIDLCRAIQYLNSNNTWVKDSLEHYNATKGLYDELNEFRTEDIEKRFRDRQLYAHKLFEVLCALRENQRSGSDPHIGKEENDGKYNPPENNEITVKEYINLLKEQHNPEPAPTKQGSSTGNNTTKAGEATGAKTNSQSQNKHLSQISHNKTPNTQQQ